MSQIKIATNHPSLRRIRTLSFLLDNSIPIPFTRYRIGLDPLLGLLPGGGDVAGTILSAYIILEAARFGLPRKTLVQMVINLVADSAFGSLPVVGDVFDATWKSNSRNLALLEAHAENPYPQKKAERGFVLLLTLVLLLIVVGVGAIAALMVSLLLRLFNAG